jgi:hypothetical protein
MNEALPVFLAVLEKLETAGIPYMVVGSIASMIYGEPRLTHDMDLVVEVLPADARKFTLLFDNEDFYCPPPEVLRAEVVQHGQFNLIHNGSGLKVDLMVRKNTPRAEEEFQRRSLKPFAGKREVFLASPEDVIISKLEFHRMGGSEKHITDIRGIMAYTALDHAYLDRWINRLGLTEYWAKVKA